MTQRPSSSRNAGRLTCFPTKTSQPFLSQSILSQPILSQSRGAPQAGGGDHRCSWTRAAGAGEPERKRTTEARRCGAVLTCNIWWSLEGAKVRLSEEDLCALHQLPKVMGRRPTPTPLGLTSIRERGIELGSRSILPQLRLVAPLAKCRCDTFRAQ
jgi:hypothetical protein